MNGAVMEKVSLLKVNAYDELLPQRITELLASLGGLAAFCKPGERVLLKPNLLAPHMVEKAVTTHPAIILAMVELLQQIGCIVAVGDSPGIGTARSCLRKLGIDAKLEQMGAVIVELQTPVAELPSRRPPQFERRFKNLYLAEELTGFDRIINLAKLKSHGQMGITFATKNLYGCVVGTNKGAWHFKAGRDRQLFGRLIVETALAVRADLHIVDGILAMDGNGPSAGRVRSLEILAAGVNPLAVDRVLVELIRKDPQYFPIFAAAQELGWPGTTLEEIETAGTPPAEWQINDFEIPGLVRTNLFGNETITRLVKGALDQWIGVDHRACIHCLKCQTHCPAKAITHDNKIVIDRRQCIMCCCCQELCPVGAMKVRETWLVRLLRRMKVM
jgi:uncharacterized protein (DUF362 family)/NAD-dependent dihydropyrimidine dehydrogenase PreA subunit